jgi:chorismate dehydratase
VTATLRVGSVPYLVGRPLDLGLGEEPGIELVHEVPARLVESLRAGEIDVAMVSSIELFRRPGYRYIDELAVAGEGHVASVQLFLRRELEQVKSIALDPASRTARTLLRVLLAEGPGEAPQFLEVPAGEDPRQTQADAWLRIGDAALREHHGGDLPYFNPSQAWAERTGLPFVFAPWIVRPGVDIEPHLPAFRAARARGAAQVEALAREAAVDWGLPLEACRHYLLEECLYEVDERMQASLLAFRDRAAALGLCQGDLTPEPIPSSELYA